MKFGITEIATSRKQMKSLIASRAYELFHVYAANSPATDLAVVGRFTIGLEDGNHVDLDFTARFVVVLDDSDADTKFQSVQVWTDPTEMKAAYGRAKETLGTRE
jgi:hypothetical protein